MSSNAHLAVSLSVMAVGAVMLLVAFIIYASVDIFYNLFDFGIFLLVGGAALLVAQSRDAGAKPDDRDKTTQA